MRSIPQSAKSPTLRVAGRPDSPHLGSGCDVASAGAMELPRHDGEPQLGIEAGGRQDLDRILRYETANGSDLNSVLDRLERLQRLRKGEYVPALVTITLAGPLNGSSEN